MSVPETPGLLRHLPRYVIKTISVLKALSLEFLSFMIGSHEHGTADVVRVSVDEAGGIIHLQDGQLNLLPTEFLDFFLTRPFHPIKH
jgi:hypothetical protein